MKSETENIRMKPKLSVLILNDVKGKNKNDEIIHRNGNKAHIK